jgi:hypothetical protein
MSVNRASEVEVMGWRGIILFGAVLVAVVLKAPRPPSNISERYSPAAAVRPRAMACNS